MPASLFALYIYSLQFLCRPFEAPSIMANSLQEAMNIKFNLKLWPTNFIEGCALVAAKRRLNIDAVALSIIMGTSAFVGKSQIRMEGSDKVDVASLWVCNVQVSLNLDSSCLILLINHLVINS